MLAGGGAERFVGHTVAARRVAGLCGCCVGGVWLSRAPLLLVRARRLGRFLAGLGFGGSWRLPPGACVLCAGVSGVEFWSRCGSCRGRLYLFRSTHIETSRDLAASEGG
jgi:hypothetical protein